MPKLVFYYFSAKAKGEAIRLLLAYGGEDFEDKRILVKDWTDYKSLMPFGEMPVLEIDGKKFAQSMAIARYLGKKYDLVGDTPEENLEIDQNIDFFMDLCKKAMDIHYEPDEAEKANKYEKNKDVFPALLSKLDDIIVKNNGHVAAGKLTWGDFVFTGMFDYLKTMLQKPDLNETYQSFKKVTDVVYALPKVKAYVENMPELEFNY